MKMLTWQSRACVRWAILSVVVLSLAIPAWADPVAPSARDRRIVLTVSALLQREHLSRHPLDDEISERCLTTFLKTLDPEKVYFQQSDIDAFMQHRHSLDDLIRKHETDGEELLEMYLTALTMSFDPHTTYMSERSMASFRIISGPHDVAIGVALRVEDGYVVVRQILAKGPADKHGGLQLEDKIVGVGQGVDGSIEDVVGMNISDVVKKIRGRAGSVVRLEVLSGSGTERKTLAIPRGAIDTGVVIQIKNADGTVKLYSDLDGGVAWDGPLVVLISKVTVGAGEVFAGAIQDYRRGVLVGDKATNGRGTVQVLKDLGAVLFRTPDSPG